MRDKSARSDQRGDMQETHYHVIGLGGQFLALRHVHAWQPPTDVMADEDRLIVTVEIAGMKDGEFQVAIDAGRLVIAGGRYSKDTAHTAYHQVEVRYGEFRAEILLPWPVDEEAITARYEDGFLRVELPRAAARSVRVVDVDKAD